MTKDKQASICAYIELYTDEHGFPPTLREIGKCFERSVVWAYNNVVELEAEGVVRREPGHPRTIVVL